MEVNKSIFKRQADFLEKNGKYILQFTGWLTDQYIFDDQKDFEWGLGSDYELGSEHEPSKNITEINYYSNKKACAIDSFEIDEKF